MLAALSEMTSNHGTPHLSSCIGDPEGCMITFVVEKFKMSAHSDVLVTALGLHKVWSFFGINPKPYYLYENAPLMGPDTVLLISIAYPLMTFALRAAMKNRKKMDLFLLRVLYNAVLLVLSFYIFAATFIGYFQEGYSWVCNITPPAPGTSLLIAQAIYVSYVLKVVEFADTLFIVLRKQDNQLSFLHVYHHSLVFPVWYFVVRYAAAGDAYTAVLYNAIAHTLMYSYYLLSSFGYRIWWKQYVLFSQLPAHLFLPVFQYLA
jgi:hypothetical protein